MDDTVDLGLGPAPLAPQAPTPISGDPSKSGQWVKLALMALSGAMGPGAGTGLAAGLAQGLQRKQERADYLNRQNQQTYDRQQQDFARSQQLYQQQAMQRQQAVAQAYEGLAKLAPSLKTRADFDAAALRYSSLLNSMGIRVPPQALAGSVPYAEPSERDAIASGFDALLSKWKGTEALKHGLPLNVHIEYTDPVSGQKKVSDKTVGDYLRLGYITAPVTADGSFVGAKPEAAGRDTRPIEVQAADALAAGDTRRYNAIMQAARGVAAARKVESAGPAKSPDKEWVIRNGQPIQIDKGTALPGDRPYQANDAKLMSTADDVRTKRHTLASNALDAIGELEGASGIRGVFGAPQLTSPGSWTRLMGMDPIAGSSAADAKVKLDRLLSLITLPELQNMRGLGAMSDREFATISKAATTLSSKMSDRAAAAELARLRQAFQNMLNGQSGTPVGDIGTTSNGSVTIGGQTFGVQVVP